MYAPKVQDWVRDRARGMSYEALALAAVTGGLALGTLLVTFGVFWVAAWFIVEAGVMAPWSLARGQVMHADPRWAALLAVGALAGLVLANRSITRTYLKRHPPRRAAGLDEGSEQPVFPVWQSLVAYPGSASATLDELLLCGPRLLSMTRAHLARMWRLRRMNPEPVAKVLGFLLAKSGRLPFEEIAWRARLTNPPATYRLLEDLGAVVFLVEDPSGLTLTGEARFGLLEAAGPLVWEGGFGTETERNAATLRSLHEMLGLSVGAGAGTVERAVRQRLSECEAVRAAGATAGLERAAAEHAVSVERAFMDYRARQQGADGAPPRDGARLWEERRGAGAATGTGDGVGGAGGRIGG